MTFPKVFRKEVISRGRKAIRFYTTESQEITDFIED
jgi:hypothetical protein